LLVCGSSLLRAVPPWPPQPSRPTSGRGLADHVPAGSNSPPPPVPCSSRAWTSCAFPRSSGGSIVMSIAAWLEPGFSGDAKAACRGSAAAPAAGAAPASLVPLLPDTPTGSDRMCPLVQLPLPPARGGLSAWSGKVASAASPGPTALMASMSLPSAPPANQDSPEVSSSARWLQPRAKTPGYTNGQHAAGSSAASTPSP